MTTYRRLARVNAATSGSWLTSSSTDAVQVTNSTLFAPGTDDFTVEWFGYYTSAPSFSTPFAIGQYAQNNYQLRMSWEGSTVYVWYSTLVGGGRQAKSIGSGFSVPLNTWTHFALVRTNATTVTFYVDGVQRYTGTLSGDGFIHYQPDALFGIGAEIQNNGAIDTGTTLPGSTSNFRWSNVARYTGSTYTVPTGHLINDPNTVLLLRAESAATMFKDSSDNNVNVAAVGTVTYQVDSPFA